MTFHGIQLFNVLTVIRKDTTKIKCQDFTGDRYWLEIIGEEELSRASFQFLANTPWLVMMKTKSYWLLKAAMIRTHRKRWLFI